VLYLEPKTVNKKKALKLELEIINKAIEPEL